MGLLKVDDKEINQAVLDIRLLLAKANAALDVATVKGLAESLARTANNLEHVSYNLRIISEVLATPFKLSGGKP